METYKDIEKYANGVVDMFIWIRKPNSKQSRKLDVYPWRSRMED